MAVLSTAQEYQQVRQAIQKLSSGKARVSFSVDGVTVTYDRDQMRWLQDRELELARRLSIRHTRKRTRPDFT